MATTHGGRTFDWRPNHDPRSRDFPVTAALEAVAPRRQVWLHGRPLNQQAEGACTGFGAAGRIAAAPQSAKGVKDAHGFAWYDLNKRTDEWPGEDYDGSSVLATMKTGRALGWWTGYRWCFGMTQVRDAVLQLGPVIIGVPWRAGMYEAPGGVLEVTGDVVGGHCLAIIGYDPAAPELGGAEGYLLLNSWGPEWGEDGAAWITATDLAGLLSKANQGEAAVPVGAKTGRLPAVRRTKAAAAPAEAAARTVTVHPLATQLQAGDRITEGVPATLGQDTATVEAIRLVAGWAGRTVRVATSAGVFTLRASERVTVRRAVA